MEKRVNLIELYEEYKKLLTEKQRKYFESYYFEDLSFNEIAEINEVTKSFVGKTINGIEKKLFTYEDNLQINKKNKMLKELVMKLDGKLKKELENILYK